MLAIHFLFLLAPAVLAGTKVRFFRNPSCDSDVLDTFGNSDAHKDNDCHIPPRNITRAIFIDDIDHNCSIITYSDYSCSAERARRKFAEKERCFFSRNGGVLRSFRIVCDKESALVSASWAESRATQVKSYTNPTPGTASITSWTTENEIANQTLSFPATQTSSMLVPGTSFKGEGIACTTGRVSNALVAALIAIGGLAVAL